MEIINTEFNDLKIINTHFVKDNRGIFNKVYNKDFYIDKSLNVNFEELFYSVSQKNVIRGMHFQVPPFDHEKLVFVIRGKVLDVVLDIRKDEKTYGKYFEIELSGNKGKALYIPMGFAHGFKSLEDETIICYLTTKVYSPEHDCGIKLDSFGYNWHINDAIISERDKSFENFQDFKSPF